MESWSCISEGKGFAPNESLSSSDLLPRSKNSFMNWEWRNPSSFSNTNFLVPDQEAQMQPVFGELGSLETTTTQRHNPCITNNQVFGDNIGGGRSTNQIMATINAFSRENEPASKFSSCVMDSKNGDSSLIDLKLGRFGDVRDSQNSKLSTRVPFLSPIDSCAPAKRVRAGGVNTQIAYCQVYGCNKDLSSSKDYHKRHKVCEAHSKTSKVIVNGIEQRFCQQCSRFHLLAEFDDDKRSCRKRLAGHNERRRKPQVGIHSGRSARSLLSYNGNSLGGNPLTAPSFICQDILPGGDLLNGEKYGRNDWCGYMKAEDGKDSGPFSTVPALQSKPPISSYSFEKQFPLFHDNGGNSTPSSNLIAGSLYQQNVGGPNSAPHCFFSENSLNSEDFSVFDTASTIQGLSGISESGCALSLLSSQSQNSSSHSSGIPVAQSLVHPSSQMHFSSIQDSSKLIGLRAHAPISGVSNKLSLSGMDSAEGNHPDALLLSNCNSGANFHISNGILQGPETGKSRNNLSCENGSTIDLLQLSSQLQRVEHQRLSLQVKRENDGFCGHQIT